MGDAAGVAGDAWREGQRGDGAGECLAARGFGARSAARSRPDAGGVGRRGPPALSTGPAAVPGAGGWGIGYGITRRNCPATRCSGCLVSGTRRIGVVVGKGGNKEERWEVKKGDSLQGFAVKEVGMDGLRLTADGKEFLLPLYAGPPTAAGGAVRTGTTRRDAAQPVAAPASTSGTAAPARRERPRRFPESGFRVLAPLPYPVAAAHHSLAPGDRKFAGRCTAEHPGKAMNEDSVINTGRIGSVDVPRRLGALLRSAV